MGKNNRSILKKQEVLDAEEFTPNLSSVYLKKFNILAKKINLLSNQEKKVILESEIEKGQCSDKKNINLLKYIASISLLKDLIQQGWNYNFEKNKPQLTFTKREITDKTQIKEQLIIERNAQFENKNTVAFLKKMEHSHNLNGKSISIKNLIGDKNILIKKISSNEKICTPYLQLVSREKDILTGFYLSDIWRYFRYTWSIPYKTTPGRNLYYLVRDSSQEYHPVIGIFALGNTILNLSVRDEDIGWTVDSIKKRLCYISNKKEHNEKLLKSEKKFIDTLLLLLNKKIDEAINCIYFRDMLSSNEIKYPTQTKINNLLSLANSEKKLILNNKKNDNNDSIDWSKETLTHLFKKKRALELAKLLKAKKELLNIPDGTNTFKLNYLLSRKRGRQTIATALIENRKCKIGSNMMDIIVCGSIPPYNELLGGKLISILACSPQVIHDYTKKYSYQVSEIASRMKGSKIIRDSHLVYLGTTSLYSIGSSQYNRIKVPLKDDFYLEFKKIGITEGYGTIFISKQTSSLLAKILEIQDNGKKNNHVFGEGTSPRLRLINRGLQSIGIKSDVFLKHYSPRIVYSINLAKNTKNFLLGFDKRIDYGFDINNPEDVKKRTQYLIDFWYKRWLTMRLTSVDIKSRLESFDKELFLLTNSIKKD